MCWPKIIEKEAEDGQFFKKKKTPRTNHLMNHLIHAFAKRPTTTILTTTSTLMFFYLNRFIKLGSAYSGIWRRHKQTEPSAAEIVCQIFNTICPDNGMKIKYKVNVV